MILQKRRCHPEEQLSAAKHCDEGSPWRCHPEEHCDEGSPRRCHPEEHCDEGSPQLPFSQQSILFFARGFGSGCIPFAPGTMGTLASLPLYFVIQKFSLTFYLILLILTFLLGIWLCDKASKLLQQLDPPSVVWDEMVGFWLTMVTFPLDWRYVLAGFLAFRFFDILKPWPIGWVDKKVHNGLGIMLDDVFAAIYANIVLQIMRIFV